MLQFKMCLLFLVLTLASLTLAENWRWHGKVAVVTGASSGIGAEIAVQLADRGMIVVGLARRDEKIKALANRTRGQIHALKCDLLNEDDILKAFRWIESNFGGVDVLINNAGALIPGSISNGTTSDWKSVMDLNVVSVGISTREALKSMRKRGDDGYIININSVFGQKVPMIQNFDSGMYAASKYALRALTETIAFELVGLRSKIKISSISPGLVDTSMSKDVKPDDQKQVSHEEQYDRPYVYPIDIAEGVVYVLSTRPYVQIPELTIQPVGGSVC